MAATILIADDYADNRELLRVLLKSADYNVCEACDGAECVRMAREETPDLILIDLSMPGLDGWEVIRILKQDARTRELPCVAVTAHSRFESSSVLAAGFAAFLPKPFRGKELLDLVELLIAGKNARTKSAAPAVSQS